VDQGRGVGEIVQVGGPINHRDAQGRCGGFLEADEGDVGELA
jgi:hypothetical protein